MKVKTFTNSHCSKLLRLVLPGNLFGQL